MKNIIIAILIALVAVLAYFLLSKPAVAPVSETTGEERGVEAENTQETTDVTPTNTESTGNSAENIIIEKSSLSEGQQKTLETFGVEGDTIVITPEMIACAEEKIGKERVDAIIAGDSPTFMEGLSLVSCY